MVKSMLRHAPRNSELGLRIAHLTDPAALEALYRMEPDLRTVAEGIAFRSEPRLWKAPVRAVANYRLLAELDVRGRTKALEAFQREPEAALYAAELLQALEYEKAKTEERNRETQPDHRWLARYLIAAEFVNVAAVMPEASAAAVRWEVGHRLGAPHDEVNIATVRRSMRDFATDQLLARPPAVRSLVYRYLALLSGYFQRGWQSRSRAVSDWPERAELMGYGRALETLVGPTASPDLPQDAVMKLELRLLSVELDRKNALGSTEPVTQA